MKISSRIVLCLLSVAYILLLCWMFHIMETSPVEGDNLHIIDSLDDKRDTLIKKRIILDSIKDAKRKEVLNLSNDSTIELWNKLVKDTSFYGGCN